MKKNLFVYILLLSVIFTVALSAENFKNKTEQKQKIIAVMGSSVAAGFVTSYRIKYDMQNGYASRLQRKMSDSGFKVVNISRPGDTTQKVLKRMGKDLLPLKADLVIIGLSLSNEGVTRKPFDAYKNFAVNLKKIIDVCMKNNIKPIIGLCYPGDDYKEKAYALIQKANLLINSWQLPSINFLGALDNGKGNFPDGIAYDIGHPGNRGHEEMYWSIVPGMFSAILNDRNVELSYNTGPGILFEKHFLSYIPDAPIHSFSMSFEFQRAGIVQGFLAKINTLSGYIILKYQNEKYQLKTKNGKEISFEISKHKNTWSQLTITYQHLMQTIMLYLNGKLLGSFSYESKPLQFLLGGVSKSNSGFLVRNVSIIRSALNIRDINWINQGNFYHSSLEFFAPLNGKYLTAGEKITNRSYNLVDAFINPAEVKKSLTELKMKILKADKERKNEFVPEEKKALFIPSEKLDQYVGRYKIAPGDHFVVKKENGKLFFIDGREKSELFFEKEHSFFIRTYIDISVNFKLTNKKITGLEFIIKRDGKVRRLIKAQKVQ